MLDHKRDHRKFQTDVDYLIKEWKIILAIDESCMEQIQDLIEFKKERLLELYQKMLDDKFLDIDALP